MKRSKFSLSHYRLMSMKMGGLYPCGLVEVLPGDTIQHATNMLVRASPLVAPVMHPCHVRVHHWFVPHRLVWDNWENFITGGPDGMNASVFPVKWSSTTYTEEGSLGDYLGLPPNASAGTNKVSALPYRAYDLIWNEWYRDQDLQTPVPVLKTDGTDSSPAVIHPVAWEKDYFTTARPWTQKGPVVTLPLTGNAPVVGIAKATQAFPNTTSGGWETGASASQTYPFSSAISNTGDGVFNVKGSAATGGTPQIFADLSEVSATTINDLRLAFALQRYEEARARYGSRYTEYLRYLGVRSSDARLQRPEYLGGGKQTLQFSEVLQTGPDDPTNGNVVGALKGHGIGAVRSNRYRRFFEEHGYVLSLISIKPRTIYTQGVARTWLRSVKEDFWQRELQHIGQQEVRNREVYAEAVEPDGTFGYQDRYDEYRRMESGVAGEFRSTLDYWHMARTFESEPVLNGSFVASNPTDRIFADQTGSDTMYVMASHSIQVRRQVAKTGASFIF